MNRPKGTSPKVCLVLGSGGIKTTSTIGLLRAVEEVGVTIDSIIATSAGSIFAALFALGMCPDEIESLVLKHWKNKAFFDIDWVSFACLLGTRIPVFAKASRRHMFGIIKGKRIERLFENIFGGAHFSQTKIPLSVVAFDAFLGEQVVLSEGAIHTAVRASISLPVLFKPVEIDPNTVLVDGGLANPLPLDLAFKTQADVIIAMGFDSPTRKTVSSPLSFGVNVINLAIKRLFEEKWAPEYQKRPGVLIIRTDLNDRIRFFQTKKIRSAIDYGYHASKEHLFDAKRRGVFNDIPCLEEVDI